MLAIESALSGITDGDVERLSPYLPNTLERIKALEPLVVIIERTGKTSELALEILAQSIPLIILDESRRTIMVLNREEVQKDEISELTDVIERINRQQDAHAGENFSEPDEQ
ncbi:MAG: hypothetical protein GTO18_00190 [Anaerolineales bacterium]|nr:hypothetical protein [Anaerolineales bacterium]